MGLTLSKGSEGMFVELEQKDVVKRFVVPNMEGLEGKLQSFVKKHPGLILVRFGRAIVASQDGATELRDGLEDIPSAVVSSCMIDLCGGHPVLHTGPARYSLDLIKEINECETETVVQEEVEQGQVTMFDIVDNGNGVDVIPNGEVKNIELPKPDLAASLRAQLEQKKEEPKVETLQDKLNAKLAEQKSKPVNEKTELILVSSKDLETVKKPETKNETPAQKAMREHFANHKNAEIVVREERPASKIDMILEKIINIEGFLTGDLDSEMSGKELAEWFWNHLDVIGEEKTFAILASRLIK